MFTKINSINGSTRSSICDTTARDRSSEIQRNQRGSRRTTLGRATQVGTQRTAASLVARRRSAPQESSPTTPRASRRRPRESIPHPHHKQASIGVAMPHTAHPNRVGGRPDAGPSCRHTATHTNCAIPHFFGRAGLPPVCACLRVDPADPTATPHTPPCKGVPRRARRLQARRRRSTDFDRTQGAAVGGNCRHTEGGARRWLWRPRLAGCQTTGLDGGGRHRVFLPSLPASLAWPPSDWDPPPPSTA